MYHIICRLCTRICVVCRPDLDRMNGRLRSEFLLGYPPEPILDYALEYAQDYVTEYMQKYKLAYALEYATDYMPDYKLDFS